MSLGVQEWGEGKRFLPLAVKYDAAILNWNSWLVLNVFSDFKYNLRFLFKEIFLWIECSGDLEPEKD